MSFLKSLGLLSAGVFFAFAGSAQAAVVTFNFDLVFSDGAVAPDGAGSPYMTVSLDDGGGTGSVTMTASIAGDVGIADVTQIYLNLDSLLDSSNLSFSYVSGESAVGVTSGNNLYQADGDGKYDILFNYTNNTFSAGETSVYNITGIGSLTANSFDFYSLPAGGNGPYLAASKWQSTGPYGEDSAWIAAVPVPAAAWLLMSGVAALGLIRRGQKKS